MENTHVFADETTVHHEEHEHEPVNGGLSNGFYVASFLILLAILILFGDMLVFILGLLGMTAAYAGYFTGLSEQEAAKH